MDLWGGLVIFCTWRKKSFLYIYTYENTVYFTEINLVKFQENWILMYVVSVIRWVCNSYAKEDLYKFILLSLSVQTIPKNRQS